MKTLEMFIELATHPEKKYVSKDFGDNIVASVDNKSSNCICFNGKGSSGFVQKNGIAILIERNWELFEEPVSWQHAIQAWIDGKTISVKSPYFSGEDGYGTIERINNKSKLEVLFRDDFIKGEWFIKN